MKKLILITLSAVVLFGCQKDRGQDGRPETTKESVVNITIHVDKAVVTRTVEPGHAGNNGDEISPTVNSVMIISYNRYGSVLAMVDLNREQMKQALWGNYKNHDGSATNLTAPAGVSIGVPSGTINVDVILNTSSSDYAKSYENINAFNTRNNKDVNGDAFDYGNNNFERIMLVTDNQGVGVPLIGNETPGSPDLDSYELAFEVKPVFARFEIYGAIDVRSPRVWTDGNGNKWNKMTIADYKTATGEDAVTGYTKGAVVGTEGFDKAAVYFPEYYWYVKVGVTADIGVRTDANSYDDEAAVDALVHGFGWVKHPQFKDVSDAKVTVVTWNPNAFYAVDVEEIYVNNIHVRTMSNDPYNHSWPGSGASKDNWFNWYQAYHIGGWHTNGVSQDNTFLCMGNMWDRIATSDKTETVNFPTVGTTSSMTVLTGKAKAIPEISSFAQSQVAERNLGVYTGKAAAFSIYAQAKSLGTLVTDKSNLANELPHIILKVKCYDTAADYAAGNYVSTKQFITVKLFTDSEKGSGSYVTSFERGNIYRFNLNDLTYAFVGGAPVPDGVLQPGVDPTDPVDPDPEMPGAEVIMTVKILPWTIKNIYPEV